MIIIRGVNVFPSEIERVLLQVKGLAPHYQIHLVKRGKMDCIELFVEIESDFFKGVAEDIKHPEVQRLKGSIQHQIKSACLISADVVMHAPKGLPRSEGKAVRIVDRRNDIGIGV